MRPAGVAEPPARVLAALCASLAPVLPVAAQNGREAPAAGGSPTPILLAPVYEGGVLKNRGINIPLNTALAPERRLALGYTASNSYLNPGRLCRFSDGFCEVAYETETSRFLGLPVEGGGRRFSEETAREIDLAVKGLVAEAHERAKAILAERRGELDRLAEVLLARETLGPEDLPKPVTTGNDTQTSP